LSGGRYEGRFLGKVPSSEKEGEKTVTAALVQAQKNLKKAREPGREAILIITSDGLRVFEASDVTWHMSSLRDTSLVSRLFGVVHGLYRFVHGHFHASLLSLASCACPILGKVARRAT
jgi:hypothetical protein